MTGAGEVADLRARGLGGLADTLQARLDYEAFLRTPAGREWQEAQHRARVRRLANMGNDVEAAAHFAEGSRGGIHETHRIDPSWRAAAAAADAGAL
jgi:hypothetical protein